MEIRYAKECVRQGLPVFPAAPDKSPLTAHGFKDASIEGRVIVSWWRDHPEALLAVPTGEVSGLLVIDIDPTGAEWYAEHMIDLECRRIHKTPRGHHLLYRMPEVSVRCSASKLAPGVDVRADGGYVVWWPAHGHEVIGDLDDIGPLPDWLMKKLRAGTNGSSKCSNSSRGGNGSLKIGEGRRNDHLARVAGALHTQGLGTDAIAVALMAENEERCDPSLDAEEVRAIAASISRYDASDPTGADEEPEPLRRPVPPPPDYPVAALGPILAPACRRLAEVLQAPEAICGQSLLAAASLAAQAHADVTIDGRRELLSLWCISIAESGERKSAADDIALAPHRDHERLQSDQHRRDAARHKDDAAVYEQGRKAALRNDDNAERDKALRALGSSPVQPLKPWTIVSSPTLEGLHKLYREGQPSLGLFHDDGGEFLGGHSMGQENRQKTAAGMSRLWDRGEFDRVRGGDGSDKFYGRRLALHLMIQPVIAESLLGDALLCGQGFLARCLLAWPSTRIGTRPYVATDLSLDPAITKYRQAVTTLLDQAPFVRDGAPQELAPYALPLAEDAKGRWVALHDEIETAMKNSGELQGVRAWGSKAAAQILRIAGVLTLLADKDARRISVEAIDQGAELVLHALDEAVRIVGTSQIPVETRHAVALLEWCHRTSLELLHSRAALQFGPYAIRTKNSFDAAIRELEKAGWARAVPRGAEIDGKHRRRVWEIHA